MSNKNGREVDRARRTLWLGDAEYALDGIFLFGGPLNVYRYEVDSGKFGQSTETYHVIHFQIDDSKYLWERIMEKIHDDKQWEFPLLRLMRRESPTKFGYELINTFFKPWFFSLIHEYGGTNSPFYKWGGPALAIACHKKDNPHIQSTDW